MYPHHPTKRNWRRMGAAIPMLIAQVQSTELPGRGRRITVLQGQSGGLRWRHEAQAIIENIEAGEFYYYFLSQSRTVVVQVAREPDGSKYLKGSIDDQEPVSLLQLSAESDAALNRGRTRISPLQKSPDPWQNAR